MCEAMDPEHWILCVYRIQALHMQTLSPHQQNKEILQ